jgi:hypothetical protein
MQAASSAAQTAVDGVHIGGLNLLLNSKGRKSGTSYNVGYWNSSRTFIVGETLTVSIKGNIPGSKLFGIWFNSGSYGGYSLQKVSNGLYSKTITVPGNTSTLTIGIYLIGNQSAGDSWSFEWIKLESGNKATDWTPAPEDVSADATTKANNAKSGAISEIVSSFTITTSGITIGSKTMALTGKVTFSSLDSSTQSTINGKATTAYVDSAKSAAISTAASDASTKANNALASAKSYSDTLKKSLGAMAYQNAVSLAKLDSTIVEGGYIKTSLIDANAIITGTLLSDKIAATAITTGKLTVTNGAKIGDFTIYNNSIQSQTGSYAAFLSNRNGLALEANTTQAGLSLCRMSTSSNSAILLEKETRIRVLNDSSTPNIYLKSKSNQGQKSVALSIESTTSSTSAEAIAIQLLSGYISGFAIKTRRISSTSAYLDNDDCFVSIIGRNTTYVYLPSSPPVGKVIFICRAAHVGIRIYGNGHSVYNSGSYPTYTEINRDGEIDMLVYDGDCWRYGWLND